MCESDIVKEKNNFEPKKTELFWRYTINRVNFSEVGLKVSDRAIFCIKSVNFDFFQIFFLNMNKHINTRVRIHFWEWSIVFWVCRM